MNKDVLLKELLKSKANNTKSVDEIIDEFIAQNAKLAGKELEAQLANLLIFINENHSMDIKELKEFVESKIKGMGLSVNPHNLEETYKKLALSSGLGVSVVFDKLDIRAIEAMRNNFYWVNQEYNAKFQDRLKDTIERVFSGEIPRAQMAQALKDEFKDELKQSTSYFEGVGEHIISQNQNISTVNQARKYGVEYYKVEAVMDNRTSPICRSMHGRIIPAKHIEKQADNITNAKNMADKKAAAVWKNAPYNDRSDKMPSNFGMPPYHFRCRTELVPVWIDDYESDGVAMRATTAPKEDEILRHIDKIGVERVLDSKAANGNHGLKDRVSERNFKQDIIKALNSITAVAPKKGEENRLNAISQNGYFMVFDGNRLITAYKRDNLKEYFKIKSATLNQEIIKSWWKI
ncbi:hypothetical protein CCAL13119_09090 [Campylobacter sp. RM13119]|uniref:phage minor head protein n=1 Tax=Campylobacter californiensis TaxID=1032243 RepID=UPI001474F385|nr:phage minor head protein [Campylobacter sp. RM13119]MBE3607078.1 hypothetical protein [Campylobacter sp. RM13119]